MSNYSGTEAEKLEKRREYDRKRNQDPKVKARMKAKRQSPEGKAMLKRASQKYRATDEYKQYKKAYRSQQKAKDVRRHGILLKTFGISLDDYKVMLDNQGGGCAICGRPDPIRSLAVDHNHTTGAIRGLLCSHCNTGLGLYEDDIERLKSAIDYLKKSEI